MLGLDEKTIRRLTWSLFAVLIALVICTFRDYGVTWDEELQSQYGQAIVDYYLSGFQDRRYEEIFNLYLYGGMFDGFAALVDRITPFPIYDTRHLLNAIFGLLGIWGTWRLGRFLGGGAVALLAALLLAATPMYYGHMFNNPKDIPFAAGIIWTIYFMARGMAARPRPQMKLILTLGVILGLTLGVRVGAVMLLAFWLGIVGWAALRRLMERRGQMNFRAAFSAVWKDEVRIVLPVALASYIVMLICWPWAQHNPVMNPLRALSEFSNFPQDVEVLLNGTIYRSTKLPWYYVPLYFGVQLPGLLLALLAVGVVSLPWLWRRMSMPQKETLLLVLLMAFVPILYAVLRHPALYDAVRHFLFAVPLFCILAALGARHVFVWAIGEFRKKWSKRWVAAGMLTAFLIFGFAQIVVMTQLHPYEYIYINRFAGGMQGAFGRYEMDYWGSSFKEAAAKLQDHVAKEGGVPPGQIYRIAICGPWDSAMIYLPPDFEPVVANEPAEFFLSTTRWMCQNMRKGREIIRVERLGVPLSVVKDLRQ